MNLDANAKIFVTGHRGMVPRDPALRAPAVWRRCEYEDDGARLAEFFELMVSEAPTLVGYFTRLRAHCASSYGFL